MSRTRNVARGFDVYLDYWHRRESLSRFVGPQRADWMSMIDIDCCEYCHLGGCSQPVALIETKLVWSQSKNATVMVNLARRTDPPLPAYLVEYDLLNPINAPENDITYFVVTDLISNTDPTEMTPTDYAEWLWSLRYPHWRSECRNPARSRMLSRYAA